MALVAGAGSSLYIPCVLTYFYFTYCGMRALRKQKGLLLPKFLTVFLFFVTLLNLLLLT